MDAPLTPGPLTPGPPAQDAGRTRVQRQPALQVRDRAVLDAVLDAGRVAHVGLVDAGHPLVLPVAHARDGDRVLLHGSTGSRLFRLLAAGAPCCLTVTLLDGWVLARSSFESSMHYRSAMVLGRARAVEGAAKTAALRAMSERWLPGRWADARPPTRRELAATLVLALPVAEWSVKVSDGPPEDPPEDVARPVWAGVLPLRGAYGEPVPAPDLAPGTALPPYLASLAASPPVAGSPS